ncbi:hypothetical protein SCP_0603850 [Sparassis crispa]|uniref:Uncharacterized protein n=1 Tax=Sparassis crispa TaxID=139825 RepID=A0A401GQA6_9APHY|nr:hypothetical protein SCP_0603850 [Sparassis crispa]GBE84406.1 hypothetical protein SCP_0603850 [Sparassis crispa]
MRENIASPSPAFYTLSVLRQACMSSMTDATRAQAEPFANPNFRATRSRRGTPPALERTHISNTRRNFRTR